MIFHYIHMNSFAFYIYLSLIPAPFFIFRQTVGKSFKFINHIFQTKGSFLIESNFHSFLSLFVFILGHRLRKCPNNFLINININVIWLSISISTFSVIRLRMIRRKCNSFDTDMDILMM